MSTADYILSIRTAAALFGDDSKATYRRLVKEWHPDTCKDPKATAVFVHINALFHQGTIKEEVKLAGATLVFRDARALLRADGRCARIEALLADLRRAAPDLDRRLPTVKRSKTTAVLFTLPPGCVSIARVMQAYPDGIPPEHVAWMASRLFELVMELSTVGYTCCGIVPEALAVMVVEHGVLVLDWRFAQAVNAKVDALPRVLLPFAPAHQKAAPVLDLACVHRTALVLLGDPSGAGTALLRRDPPLPRKLLDWFRSAPGADPVEHYKEYRQLLTAVFGPPKYHTLKL
jgi:hypothetical protein